MIAAFDLRQFGKCWEDTSHDGVIKMLPILFYLFLDPQLVKTTPASLFWVEMPTPKKITFEIHIHLSNSISVSDRNNGFTPSKASISGSKSVLNIEQNQVVLYIVVVA